MPSMLKDWHFLDLINTFHIPNMEPEATNLRKETRLLPDFKNGFGRLNIDIWMWAKL